jgi:hypothetical protein
VAAPDYVPKPTDDSARVYSSPPRRPESWVADRPAELSGRQPLGARLGAPGPDQGFALKLARQFTGKLVLVPSESEADALSGCLAIAMRRSAIYGRAPVVHDLSLALTLWGFLAEAPADLVAVRSQVFASVASPHHYVERRAIVDGVNEEILRSSVADVASMARDEPRRILAMAQDVLAAQHSAAATAH